MDPALASIWPVRRLNGPLNLLNDSVCREKMATSVINPQTPNINSGEFALLKMSQIEIHTLLLIVLIILQAGMSYVIAILHILGNL